ncbi:MAG TPA: CDP-alcohol phosphatidyltransferase family protein [Gaiellaceae bacterium]|nr:CDP-alcohol phosphatidyltransferase family protein [Gaiellaceae bacterium]
MPDRKPRQGIELVCEYAFRPAAHLLARALRPLRVPPPAVVLAATCVGLGAAVAIGAGHFLVGAVLLQLKTLLDNADGQLARLSGRITAFGRYLDSESDLLVDAAVFAALGVHVGPVLALAGFLALTLVLSANFNVERLYRSAHGRTPSSSGEPEDRKTRVVAALYRVLYEPQDRLFDALARRRPAAWHEPRGVQVLANMGLSTQLAVLGLCLALSQPAAYVYVTFGCLALFGLVLARRELLVRRGPRPSLIPE